MNLPTDSVVFAALIITLAYTVFGLTGFGSSITAMPLLALLFPVRFAVPLMLVFDLCTSLLLSLRNWKAVDRRELLRLVPFILVGMTLGVTLLIHAPERTLLLLLGLFVLAYAGWGLTRRAGVTPISARWAAPLGAVGGIFTALFGTGGPIYAIYLARRLFDKTTLRATNGSLIFISALARLALFTGTGLYSQPNLLALALLLLPCAFLGVYIGSHLHHKLPAQRVVQAIWIILIVGGTSLVWRSVMG